MEVKFDFSCEELPLEDGGSITVRSLNAWAHHDGRTAISSISVTGDETPEQQELLRTLASAEAQKYLLN